MPEALVISVGQCGNQISKQFWDLSLQEHAKNGGGSYDEALATFYRHADMRNGIENIGVKDGLVPICNLKARGLLVDMEEGVVNSIMSSPVGELFDEHQVIVSNSGSGNNWAQGYHHYGTLFREQILDSLRKEAEFCDSLQSIVTIQSMGGGTGSGLGSYISELIRDDMPEIWRFGVGIVPSETDDVITSPYNSILSLNKLTRSCDCILPVDNQSLINIYERIAMVPDNIKRKPSSSLIDNGTATRKIYDNNATRKKKNEAFDTMNNIVANLLLNMTCSMRFEGTMNVDINDIVTNLIPFPELNFLTSSMTPFYNTKDLKSSAKVLDQLFTDAYHPDSQLLHIDPRKSVFLATAIIARGSIELSDIRRNIERMRSHLRFASWNGDGWKTGLCDVPALGQSHSILSLSNNTGFRTISDRLLSRFKKLYKRRAHLHHYLEWMEEEEFSVAARGVGRVSSGYQEIEMKS